MWIGEVYGRKRNMEVNVGQCRVTDIVRGLSGRRRGMMQMPAIPLRLAFGMWDPVGPDARSLPAWLAGAAPAGTPWWNRWEAEPIGR